MVVTVGEYTVHWSFDTVDGSEILHQLICPSGINRHGILSFGDWIPRDRSFFHIFYCVLYILQEGAPLVIR